MGQETRTILEELCWVIEQRKGAQADESYTAQLLTGGVELIGAKIVEEAAELVAAFRAFQPTDRQLLVHEAADLMFHLLVLLGYREINWAEVATELVRRRQRSGLAGKPYQAADKRTASPGQPPTGDPP